jgi:FKBP-type peptidyl-prolyl cis-trans isomerase FklB
MSNKPTAPSRHHLLSRKPIIKGAFIGLLLASSSLQAQLQTIEQKASYAIGINFAKSIQMQGIKLDSQSVAQGIKDGLDGNETVLTIEQMQQALDAYKAQIISEQEELQGQQSVANKQEGEAFLAANKNKPGVITLKSGLQYKVLKSGSGPSPKLTDKVTTHYRGTLINGKEFDSSYSRNEPTSFPVNGVIAGWTEALQLMHQGDKWQLFVPAHLAYGNRAVGNLIEPNSTLIFEIELLGIN